MESVSDRQMIESPLRVEGVVTPPGDKSVSQRALLLNSIANGKSHISNLCEGDDRTSILRCLIGLGADISEISTCSTHTNTECYEVVGNGPSGLTEPSEVLNAGNSGTTMRLVSGILSGQPFLSVISGDRSLNARPMDRIVQPLTKMGAQIIGRCNSSLAPLAIRGGNLSGIDYKMEIPSAQVKSSLMIAALYAKGHTTITQPAQSRDHTERMLNSMGANIQIDGLRVIVGESDLTAVDTEVPSDISAAAFWLIAGCCHPNARIRINRVGINPTRAGVLKVLESMGANIRLENLRDEGGEPEADIIAETSDLVGTEVGGDMIATVIDELPVLSLAASLAKGTTVITDAAELRVKESDRIKATVDGLSRLGANVKERSDGMLIHGVQRLVGSECDSYGDHRIAMTMGIAGLLASGTTTVKDAHSAAISYPNFWNTLYDLSSSSPNS
ncbi:MAG: 3-phosphoshikimate 1-carboxyvinyltransferase [SAR202 cluster bacterium]|nr:3-phosphoshikimate 1-carboxyvinyltransferase [SAR202 cluster bacterium]